MATPKQKRKLSPAERRRRADQARINFGIVYKSRRTGRLTSRTGYTGYDTAQQYHIAPPTAVGLGDQIQYRGGSREAERALNAQDAVRLYIPGRGLGAGNVLSPGGAASFLRD